MSRPSAMRANPYHRASRDDLSDEELLSQLKAIKSLVEAQIFELSLLSAPGKWGKKPETRRQIKRMGAHLAGIENTTRLRAATEAEIKTYRKTNRNKEANHG